MSYIPVRWRPRPKLLLDAWLRDKGWPDRELAERLNVSREYVRRIRRGDSKPSGQIIRDIKKVTRGRVSRRDILAAYAKTQGTAHGTMDSV